MYPFVRFLATLWRARRATPLDPGGIDEATFVCRPWDLDMFIEMNNGRVLTLYDLGRFSLSVRTGLAAALRKHRWGLVVAGSTVRYRKRIRAFDRVTIRTQVAGFDGRWIYVLQSMWVKGEPCSSVLLRTAVTSKKGTVPAEEVSRAMGADGWQPEMPAWAHAWEAGEKVRDWPPVP